MIETTEHLDGDAAPESQTTPVVETVQTETPTNSDTTATNSDAAPEATEDPKPEPKPKRTDRHIAHLTARAADEQRLREAAERRADAAEALLRAGRQGDDETPPPPRQDAPQDVEARAAQLVQEREFNRRLGEIDATGKKELGADQWEQAKATLTGLGAVNNQAFLQALAETDAPHKIFASLADDTDALMDLLKKSPAAMAAKLGHMDADLSRPAARPLSAAPTPATRVQGGGATVKDFDPYNPPVGMSMKAWNREMDKHLPPHLGGTRKSA